MPQNNQVTYLLGDKTVSNRPLVPYEAHLCEFLNDLSCGLRSSKEARGYPDVMTFSFWCRKANIAKLKAEFEDGKARLGLGLAFHITPSNLPVNFAFSFAFGLLSGNANIVRVPSRRFAQIDIICACLERLFDNHKYSRIKAMTAFVSYAQNDEITAKFSANCNARIIWGGDAAVNSIRKLPIPERSVDLVFPDRYSFCVIDAPSVLKLDQAKLQRLAKNFYNDTYLMDQNACSSPHLIVWQGGKKEIAKERFWTAVAGIVAKAYPLAAANAVDKYNLLCRSAIELNNISCFKKHSNYVYRIAMKSLPADMHALRGTCGYFYEYDTDDLNRIAHIINAKYQTLTYFGADKRKLLDFVVKNRLLGIDRIVPVGQSLDITVIWDGYDVIKSLSRIIDLKGD